LDPRDIFLRYNYAGKKKKKPLFIFAAENYKSKKK